MLACTFDPAGAGIPDQSLSYFVPQAGTLASPLTGTAAIALFKACPNNDGGTSLPNNARIKVMVRDVNGIPISGVAAADICVLFNGGTPAQGFYGIGADSVVANSTWNPSPRCPDVRCLTADAPTDTNGVTYVTFTGTDGTVAGRGIGVRDPNRKWGHYDTELPVYVLGHKIYGRVTEIGPIIAYTLRIKNFDVVEGLGPDLNEGEVVTTADLSTMIWHLSSSSPITYWLDFNNSGSITALDVNQMIAHFNHDCDTPNNP